MRMHSLNVSFPAMGVRRQFDGRPGVRVRVARPLFHGDHDHLV